jgi:hypothetical protein
MAEQHSERTKQDYRPLGSGRCVPPQPIITPLSQKDGGVLLFGCIVEAAPGALKSPLLTADIV